MQEIDVRASIIILESGTRSITNGTYIEVDGTTDCIILRDVGTSDGGPISNPAGSGKPNPPLVERSLVLCAIGSLHLPTSDFDLLCIGDNCKNYFRGGVNKM